ncbi:thiamine-phosphate kinase [Desulfofustis glycolicus]|uniref:Thiamine-monophosphate kinase n=1 Tax=Desulfofustis glycolicus DSM 9705 TaxID=1121409 RepID=A0A1M5U8I9_9BACT|nr:thiamine-phosphate kinase [Desulfofustis glycolicus]MCB2214586.1 thiamine-phosphate kinase [Desulfobulbaceae bacterium]SHH59375.1 thiamine-phosphate kinase [Desulfofustis glycolicus DSM 9705]
MPAHWSELDLIKHFAGSCRIDKKQLIKGIGDDCAVLHPAGDEAWVLTTDMLVDTVHFDTSWHPAFQLGRKCLAVNLSDIAAMGATPHSVMLSVALPDTIETVWLEQWLQGLASMIDEFDCALIGGDTVRGAQLTISITALGTTARNRVILRSTAGPGDTIFVSGYLGSAAAGLLFCRDKAALPAVDEQLKAPFIKRHLDPSPDVFCGSLLAQSGLVTAMQDLSDGLATDLAHIAEQSHLAAIVDAERLPGHPDLAQVCRLLERSPIDLQVAGGDDYHLVFTVKRGAEQELIDYLARHDGPPIYKIGRTEPGSGVHLLHDGESSDIAFRGFQHHGND